MAPSQRSDPGAGRSRIPFDFDALREVTGNDPEFEREILEDFLSHTARLFESQRAAADAGDVRSLERDAHSLKGASRTLGANQLGQLAQEVEQFARGRDLDRAVASLDHAVREFEGLQDLLRRHIQRLAA